MGRLAAVVAAAATLTAGNGQTDLALDEAAATAPKPPSYTWPPFTNWDCVGVRGVLDWDEVYGQVLAGLRSPEQEERWLLFDAVVEAFQGHTAEMSAECPLGSLYFLVLYTYRMIQGGGMEAVQQSQHLASALRQFPFFVVAGGRWPTFEALDHFSHMHKALSRKAIENTLCEGVRGTSGIEWDAVLVAAKSWSAEQMGGFEPGEMPSGSEQVHQALSRAAAALRTGHEAAQDECPFGFLYLCTTQVLAAAVRLTGSLEGWARAVDKMMAELPFFSISASQWPTFQMLAMLSSQTKGDESAATLGSFQADIHRWGGTHPSTKRFRQFGDLRLLEPELCPLGRNMQGWTLVDQFASLSAEAWYGSMAERRSQNLRPIMADALDAVMTVVRFAAVPSRLECGHSGISAADCRARGCTWAEAHERPDHGLRAPACQRHAPARKVVAVTFVWGKKWARLIPRFAAWAMRLAMGVVIVAMGDACRTACEAAARALGGSAPGVACWDPLKGATGAAEGSSQRGSILQRHAMVHLLLHLGVDALAFDFDTFFFEDPRMYLEAIASAEDAQVLMARHLDADCLNMGMIYIQASARAAKWYSQYLDWLHLHPFEREQRGMNSLLGFTKQRVSFPPEEMPQLKVVALDDANEFASSRGGWLGDWSRLRFFHWVNPSETASHWSDVKVGDLTALYEAALHPATDILGAGGSMARVLAGAGPGSLLRPVRDLMDSMRVAEAPPRRECW